MLVLVAMLGLTKTQALAAGSHVYNFVNEATKTTAKIEWSADFYGDKVPSGFIIYYNEGAAIDWNNYRIATAGADARSFTFTGLKPGTYYAVNVQASMVDKEGNSYPNMNVLHAHIITLPDKIKNVEVSTLSSGTKLVVTFDQQSGCDYEYRVTGLNGKIIPKLSGVKEANYILPGKITIKNANAKKNGYLVSVRSKFKLAGKMVYGDWSKPVAVLPKVKVNSATMKAGKITVAWDKTADATEYMVYAATSKNGTYTKVGTTKKNVSTLTFSKIKGKRISSSKAYYIGVVAKTKVKSTVYKTPMAVKAVKKVK